MLAADKGHAACVKALLDAGADASVVDREGRTARDLALELYDSQSRTRIVALLDNATL
jgi:ankyrin repeat protein